MAQREGHGWWPYWVPLFSFLGILQFAGWLPEAAQPLCFAASVLAPGLLFAFYYRRGEYPELRTPGWQRGAALDLLVGVVGAAVWMGPYVAALWAGFPLWESLPELFRPAADAGFDTAQFGASFAWLALSLRCIGFGVVTPFVEEIFMRSWLPRYADVLDGSGDFRDVPIGRFSWRSFLIVVTFFTVAHVPWEWPVAVLWVAGTQLWLYHRKQLMALVLVHAASNLSIFFFVLASAGRLTDASGAPLDLWVFL